MSSNNPPNSSNLYCIEHLYSECKLSAMLIPFGLYKNAWVNKLQYGAEVLTLDNPPVKIKVFDRITLPIRSTLTNSISMLVYGKPIETVYDGMFRNYGHDISKREVILLIYKAIDYVKPVKTPEPQDPVESDSEPQDEIIYESSSFRLLSSSE